MRKCKMIWVLLAGMLCITGCGEKEKIEKVPDDTVITGQIAGTEVPKQKKSEDYVWGNKTYSNLTQLLWTETGYYYYDLELEAMRYYDNATGKTTYLCNKPECRHDGNQFCVATNDAYTHIAHAMYSGKIYVVASQETDTQLHLKLLEMALDGSELSEVVTVYTLEKTGDEIRFYGSAPTFHRDYVMVPMEAYGLDDAGPYYNPEPEYHKGTAVINLKTKEVSFLDEEPLRKENIGVEQVNAYGDYFFYSKQLKKKTELHYYDFKKKEDNVCKLLINFKGKYIVLDEKTVLYLKSDKVCSYDLETGENAEGILEETFWESFHYEKEIEEGKIAVWDDEYRTGARNIYTDGEYIYISLTEHSMVAGKYFYLNIYDKKLNLLRKINMADHIKSVPGLEELIENEEHRYYSWNCNLFFRYTGEVMHYEIPLDGTHECYLYRVNREDLLAGNPSFEFVYQGIRYWHELMLWD